MPRTLDRLNNPSLLIALLVFGLSVDLVLLGRAFDLDKAEWAAWVQAIGSVLAILVAVAVAWHQTESQRRLEREREREQTMGMLRALRTEIAATLGHVDRAIAPSLAEPNHDTAFRVIYPLSEDPFVIFNALIPRLGSIDDDELRTQIVRTYGEAKGLVLTFRYNNELVAAMDTAEALLVRDQSEANALAVKACSKSLIRYGASLRISYDRVRREVDNLMARLANI